MMQLGYASAILPDLSLEEASRVNALADSAGITSGLTTPTPSPDQDEAQVGIDHIKQV